MVHPHRMCQLWISEAKTKLPLSWSTMKGSLWRTYHFLKNFAAVFHLSEIIVFSGDNLISREDVLSMTPPGHNGRLIWVPVTFFLGMSYKYYVSKPTWHQSSTLSENYGTKVSRIASNFCNCFFEDICYKLEQCRHTLKNWHLQKNIFKG